MTLFIEVNKSERIKNFSSGVMRINKKTWSKANHTVLNQHMATDEATITEVKNSIMENGFNPSFPIVLHSEMLNTIDGYTRLRACLELIADGYVDEILVPFYTALEEGEMFNPASRGASADDIASFFAIPRHNGLLTGSSRRAAEQAIEASKMLDVAKLDGNFEKAFDTTRIQRHTGKIVRDKDIFVNAYRAVCELATKLEVSPDTLKWAHWLAFFCRHGVSGTNKAIALRTTVPAKGTTQRARYEAFESCCDQSVKLGGL